MPNVLQADKIVGGIAKVYHDGDKSRDLKKHRWPILGATSKMSKVKGKPTKNLVYHFCYSKPVNCKLYIIYIAF
jgi:hypothetical protein